MFKDLSFKKVISITLALIMVFSVFTGVFTVSAEEAPTYSVLGVETAYNNEQFAVTGEKLENGADILKVNGEVSLVLNEKIQDFSVEFKYKDKAVVLPKSDPLNFGVSMRNTGKDAYVFGLHYYAGVNVPATDILFNGYSETEYRQQSGVNFSSWYGGDEWNTFKIVMAGQKVSIFKNGVLWYSAQLKDKARPGALSLDFSGAYETYIADVKVVEATELDAYAVFDASFDSETYAPFGVTSGGTAYTYSDRRFLRTATYDSTRGGNIIGEKDKSEYFELTFANGIKSYLFEAELQIDTANVQRGVILHSPSGYSYRLTSSGWATGPSNGISFDNKVAGTVISFTDAVNYGSLNDGNWHKVNLSYNYGIEKLYVDGRLICKNELSEPTEDGNFIFHVAKADGTVWAKNVRLIDTGVVKPNATVYEYPNLNSNTGNAVFGNGWNNIGWDYNPDFNGKPAAVEQTSYATNGKTLILNNDLSQTELSMDLFIPDTVASGNVAQFNFGGMNNNSGSSGFTLTLTDVQCYVAYYSTTKSAATVAKYCRYDNTTIFNQTILGHWVELDIKMFGNNLIVTVDGAVIANVNDISYARTDGTIQNFLQLYKKAIAVSNVRCNSLENLTSAINAVNNVSTYDENGFIDDSEREAAINAYTKLGEKADREYIENITNSKWWDIYFDTGDINMDCQVNLIDLVSLKKMVAGLKDTTIKANINRDSNIDSTDLAVIIKIILEII